MREEIFFFFYGKGSEEQLKRKGRRGSFADEFQWLVVPKRKKKRK
jgi:hypothetical protein